MYLCVERAKNNNLIPYNVPLYHTITFEDGDVTVVVCVTELCIIDHVKINFVVYVLRSVIQLLLIPLQLAIWLLLLIPFQLAIRLLLMLFFRRAIMLHLIMDCWRAIRLLLIMDCGRAIRLLMIMDCWRAIRLHLIMDCSLACRLLFGLFSKLK
jgi:hypothetical protein